eukprot:TRINITY_DN14741_c0_g1_i1.p1 TRINITY_DN14741_c0_g1~~TRINITY_DN14741_c0_g1_i1.p1  ORF type:complete len:182 (-),score=34.55 TRINITY_DN14741_c0_g1_i1:7-552(-)
MGVLRGWLEGGTRGLGFGGERTLAGHHAAAALPEARCVRHHLAEAVSLSSCGGNASRSRATATAFLGLHPSSFAKDEDDIEAEAEEGETPVAKDSPLSNLAKFRAKHERTQDGFLCSAAGVKDEQAFTGCTDLPTPDGSNFGRKWCYIEPSQVQEAGRPWGYCRSWSGWPDIVEGKELSAS